MEQFEHIEHIQQKQKNNFWKGALCGALAMLAVSLIVGGILVISTLMKRSTANGEDGIVSGRTLWKLEAIQDLIDKYYLYSDEVDAEVLQDYLI